MDSAPDIAITLEAWLKQFMAESAVASAPTFCEIGTPADPGVILPALAALAAEALARDRSLWIVTADDTPLPDISNALDLGLRPLCLVLPGADYAGRIALRATLSLLKSRLARAAEESAGPAWATMRARLHEEDALWRACLAWSLRGLDREAPPARIGSLFPVRIGPWALAERLAAPADWVMLIQSAQLPAHVRTPWAGARCTLMLAGKPITGATGLTVIDETARLRAEIEVLGQELAEMELELATAQGELAGFTGRYHQLIAGRMIELDRIRADLAKLRMQQDPDNPALGTEAERAEARAQQSRRENDAFRAQESGHNGTDGHTTAFTPGNALKKRFRQLAQKIHPDRASSEDDRAWRTQLMSEANRAYRNGNIAALDEVLSLWIEGQHGRRSTPAEPVTPASTSRDVAVLTGEVARIRQRIAEIATTLDRLYGSRLYELFAAARVATRQGRDLLQEMADQIDGQIAQAQSMLDSLTPAGVD
jgi:hypothetical protein